MKKRPVYVHEGFATHIHSFMEEVEFKLGEALRCVGNTDYENESGESVPEGLEFDSKTLREESEKLVEAMNSIKKVIPILKGIEDHFLKREKEDVYGWDIAERLGHIERHFWVGDGLTLMRDVNLDSVYIDNAKLNVEFKNILEKAEKVFAQSNEIRHSLSNLDTMIKDGEYDSKFAIEEQRKAEEEWEKQNG